MARKDILSIVNVEVFFIGECVSCNALLSKMIFVCTRQHQLLMSSSKVVSKVF